MKTILSLCVLLLFLNLGLSADSGRRRSSIEEAEEPRNPESPVNNEIEPDVSDEISKEDEEKIRKNPCNDFPCSLGQKCVLDKEQKPECVCLEQCSDEPDERRRICSNYNETWQSDCEVHRMRCLCKNSDPRCTEEKFKHVHIDYYGACRDIEDCSVENLEDFPRRMREWLFNIMDDLAKSDELEPGYGELLTEAEKDDEYKWINPIIWKFCDLDVLPSDRTVSRHELIPIRAPLLAMEHCMAPFLDTCDPDNDHQVSLQEWGKCLGVDTEKITDRCIRK